MKKRITAIFLALCLMMTLTVPAFAAGAGTTNWMSAIDGNLTLAQFTIPGTHDSCTQYCVLGRCQYLGVNEQLNMGARFLDIRLKEESGELNCYHGFINCFYSFEQVMEVVSAFLKAHPSETVIMSVKNEGDSSAEFESVLVKEWIDSEKYGDLFFTENRIPKLNEVRGKIVLMRRYGCYDASLARGIDASRNWSDNASFMISQKGFDMYVQDIYSYNTYGLSFGNSKFANFVKFDIDISSKDPTNAPNTMMINFASGCNTIGCGQLSCATVVNNNLIKLMGSAKGNHGIVIMDYVEPRLVRTVYEINFR